MIYFLVAGLVGAVAGGWLGWAHGILATIIAAPVGASLFVFLAALIIRGWQIASEESARRKQGARAPLPEPEARRKPL